MNKVRKCLLLAVLSLFICNSAMAAFVLNGTRFIYEEGKKNISFEVNNKSDDLYGGQVWIDNSDEGNTVYMIPTPAFFRILPNGKQTLRIMNVDPNLPKNIESLFWLNVQEVPSIPKNEEGNALAIAMNTQVKLIYRPKVLIEGRKGSESKIKLENKNGTSYLVNPTPYYFAVINVKDNGKNIMLSEKVTKSLSKLAPKESVDLGKLISGNISIDAINDWGGINSYDIK